MACASAFGLAISLAVFGDKLIGDRFEPGPPVDPVLVALVQFAIFSVFGAILLGTADLLLDAVKPRRTALWLGLAPLLLPGFVLALLAVTGWEGLGDLPEPYWPVLAVASVSAAISWWSFLPRPGEQLAELFR